MRIKYTTISPTKEGLEELIVDKNLFENPHYKEALIIYNKLKELLKGKIKDSTTF